MLSLKLLGLLALICICSADPIPLEEVDLPPGFIVNIFTNATPKARSLAVSGGDSNIAYISNDLLVIVLSCLSLLCFAVNQHVRRLGAFQDTLRDRGGAAV